MKPFILTDVLAQRQYDKDLHSLLEKAVHLYELEKTLCDRNGVYRDFDALHTREVRTLVGLEVEAGHLYDKNIGKSFFRGEEATRLAAFKSSLDYAHTFGVRGQDFLDSMEYLEHALTKICDEKDYVDLKTKMARIGPPPQRREVQIQNPVHTL